MKGVITINNKYIYETHDIMEILNISKNSAYKLIKSGEIPCKQIGNRYKIPVMGFENWLNNSNPLNNNLIDDRMNPVVCDLVRLVKDERSTV